MSSAQCPAPADSTANDNGPSHKNNNDEDEDKGKGDEDSLRERLGSRFKCAACGTALRKPITRCSAGHCVCEICFKDEEEKTCSICHEEYPTPPIDTSLMESVIEDLDLPADCRFYSRGCKFNTPWGDGGELAKHQDACLYRKVCCPLMVCGDVCLAKDLEHHFKENHSDLCNATTWLQQTDDLTTAFVKTWKMGESRFFAAIFQFNRELKTEEWSICVTMLADYAESDKFRMEARISRTKSTLVFNGPIYSLDEEDWEYDDADDEGADEEADEAKLKITAGTLGGDDVDLQLCENVQVTVYRQTLNVDDVDGKQSSPKKMTVEEA